MGNKAKKYFLLLFLGFFPSFVMAQGEVCVGFMAGGSYMNTTANLKDIAAKSGEAQYYHKDGSFSLISYIIGIYGSYLFSYEEWVLGPELFASWGPTSQKFEDKSSPEDIAMKLGQKERGYTTVSQNFRGGLLFCAGQNDGPWLWLIKFGPALGTASFHTQYSVKAQSQGYPKEQSVNGMFFGGSLGGDLSYTLQHGDLKYRLGIGHYSTLYAPLSRRSAPIKGGEFEVKTQMIYRGDFFIYIGFLF